MSEQIKQIEEQTKQIKIVLDNLANKNFTLYFFTLDTKGNPTAGIANIYEHVKLLNGLGYKAAILHEKNDYRLKGDENGNGITEWLGAEYAALPHVSIEGQQLNVTPADFIIIPEIFANIMDQVKGFPCKKIVFSQSYDYLLELLPIGKRWNADFGFNDVITTSTKQAQYLSNLFPSIRTHVVPVAIPSYFKDSDKPKVPVVAILTRNPGDAAKIAKSFYLQYPVYKWITFKELRGIPREQFASELSKCCLAVWVDETSGFGTFPLEAIECNTPVIGKMPNLIPEWMETRDESNNLIIKNNGVWTNTTINIPELIATFMKVWLEDSVPSDLTNGVKESQGLYTSEKQQVILASVYNGLFENRKEELNNMISALDVQAAKITEQANA
jgi:glycosyltransferase involved in cell wall biosynthesis